MTVSKSVYQGSNPCQPVVYIVCYMLTFGNCGLSITDFLSLSSGRLGAIIVLMNFHPFGNCGLSITVIKAGVTNVPSKHESLNYGNWK